MVSTAPALIDISASEATSTFGALIVMPSGLIRMLLAPTFSSIDAPASSTHWLPTCVSCLPPTCSAMSLPTRLV